MSVPELSLYGPLPNLLPPCLHLNIQAVFYGMPLGLQGQCTGGTGVVLADL